MTTAGLVFYTFEDLWVVPTQGRTPDGSIIHIEPVRLIQEDEVHRECRRAVSVSYRREVLSVLFRQYLILQRSKKVMRALGGLPVKTNAETWMPPSATP